MERNERTKLQNEIKEEDEIITIIILLHIVISVSNKPTINLISKTAKMLCIEKNVTRK